jgi:hypothetical protein
MWLPVLPQNRLGIELATNSGHAKIHTSDNGSQQAVSKTCFPSRFGSDYLSEPNSYFLACLDERRSLK